MKKLVLILPIALAITLLSGCDTANTGDDYISCTIEQKNATFCTTQYMPVCGQDGITYGNICDACLNTDSYKDGECKCSDSSQTCNVGDLTDTDIDSQDTEANGQDTEFANENPETVISVPAPNFD